MAITDEPERESKIENVRIATARWDAILDLLSSILVPLSVHLWFIYYSINNTKELFIAWTHIYHSLI